MVVYSAITLTGHLPPERAGAEGVVTWEEEEPAETFLTLPLSEVVGVVAVLVGVVDFPHPCNSR